MSTGKQYVVFDWDNTIRKGYTLYSWVDYLISQSIIPPNLQFELADIKSQYINHLITHDEYANIACKKYAKALTNLKVQDMNRMVESYLTYDKRHLMPKINLLFQAIYNGGFDIIVISGAPFIVLQGYKNLFHIKSIYAFKEKVLNGIFTGEVECNYGFNKQKKISELFLEYGTNPYAAFGDSDSDLPMLQTANYPFCLNGLLPVNGCIKVSSENIYSDVTRILQL